MGHNPSKSSPLLVFMVLVLSIIHAQATGFLTLESSPTGAEVWYTGPDDPDKKYLGDTPLENRELPTGHYNMWLILPSHDTLAVPDINIAEGQVTQMNREIPTHYGYLEVSTDPDSAEIQLDGVKIGPSPYVNNLVLPGVSKLRVTPREAHFRSSVRTLTMGKGDSSKMMISPPYRDKSFGNENLSLPNWRLQLESGLQYRSKSAIYDSASKRILLATDSIPSQWDFPIGIRLGLPQGFEIHLLLPFKTYTDSLAVFPSNMKAGVKYTYRPLNIGFDMSYALGFKNSQDGFSHDYLALTLMAMASKGKILGQGQGGFEFHFSDKKDNKSSPGDQAFVHAQLGYLVDPFLPYLGMTARIKLNDSYNGKISETSGYVLVPEPGFVIDVADIVSVQFGVPFTIVGKREASYWGLQLSMTFGFGM